MIPDLFGEGFDENSSRKVVSCSMYKLKIARIMVYVNLRKSQTLKHVIMSSRDDSRISIVVFYEKNYCVTVIVTKEENIN